MEKIDVVYVLGNGSKWNDNELRYSLRSIEMYLDGYRNIYIIGGINKEGFLDLPDFVNKDKVIYIPYITPIPPSEITPSQDILSKLKAACNHLTISENFIAFQDDYFLTKRVDGTNLGNQCGQSLFHTILDVSWNNWYRDYMKNTYWYLAKKYQNDDFYYYDFHYPIIYNKQKFLDTFKDFNLDKFVIKTIYGNVNKIKPHFFVDCKIKDMYHLDTIKRFIKGNFMFSTGDECLTDEFKEYFEVLYPNKSKYEK